MKALIPVAGAGTRLRPLTYTQPKPLIPVAGRAIVSIIIDQLRDNGIDEFIFVIGYLGEKVQTYIDSHYPNLKKTYVQQTERKGLGHAVWSAREAFDKDDDVLIVLGDTIVDVDLKSILKYQGNCLGVKQVETPWQFGVAEIDDTNLDDQFPLVKSVTEKPKIPISNWALVGLYRIQAVQNLFGALEQLIAQGKETQGEIQLTDGIMSLIKQGETFRAAEVENWFDCGQREILLKTNSTMLQRRGYASTDLPLYDNTIIIPPVFIGKGCQIENSIIGPNVTIGDDARLSRAIVRDSIIGQYASIEEVVLNRSVVGNDASVKGFSQSLNIGDNTEIDFTN